MTIEKYEFYPAISPDLVSIEASRQSPTILGVAAKQPLTHPHYGDTGLDITVHIDQNQQKVGLVHVGRGRLVEILNYRLAGQLLSQWYRIYSPGDENVIYLGPEAEERRFESLQLADPRLPDLIHTLLRYTPENRHLR